MSNTLNILPSLGKHTSILIPPNLSDGPLYTGMIQLSFIADHDISLQDEILELWTNSPSEIDLNSRSWHAVKFEEVQYPSEVETLKGPSDKATVRLNLSAPSSDLKQPVRTTYIAHIAVPARPSSFEYTYRLTSPTSSIRWLGDVRGNGAIDLVHQEASEGELVRCVIVEDDRDRFKWFGREERMLGVEMKDGTTPIIHFEHPPPGTLLRFLLITTKPTASSFATFYPPNTFISAAQEPRIILPGEGTAMVSTGNGIFHLVSVDDNGQTTDHSEQTPTPSIIPLSSDLSHIDSNLFKHITTNLSHSHLSMCVTPPKHSSPTHVVIFNLLTTSSSRVSVKTVGGPRYVLYCRALERGAIVNERIEPVDVLLGDNGRVTGHVLEMIRLKDIGGGNSIGSLDPSLTERAVKDRTADSDIAQAIKVVESARSSSEGEGGTLFSETERSTLPSDVVETPCCTTVESTSDMDSTATGLPPRPKSRLPPPRVSWSTPSDGSPGIPHYVDIDTDNPSTSTKDREEQTIGTLRRYGIPVQRGWCWWVGGWIVFWLKVGVVWLARSLGMRETEHGDNGGRERTPLMKNASRPGSKPLRATKGGQKVKKSNAPRISTTISQTAQDIFFTISHPPPFHFLVAAKTGDIVFEARGMDRSNWINMEIECKREVGDGLDLLSVAPTVEDSIEEGQNGEVRVRDSRRGEC